MRSPQNLPEVGSQPVGFRQIHSVIERVFFDRGLELIAQEAVGLGFFQQEDAY